MKKYNFYNKGILYGLLVLLIGVSVGPNISGSLSDNFEIDTAAGNDCGCNKPG